MKKGLLRWELIGVFAIFILQSILHFAYEFTSIKGLALISAVNESVWEHLKIGFYGALLFYIVEYFHIGKYPNFLFAKLISLYFIPIFIVVTYYTYTGILGKHFLLVDLLIAFVAGMLAQILSYKIITSPKDYSSLNFLSIILIIIAIITFTIFTFKPPHIPLFFDKTNAKYGI